MIRRKRNRQLWSPTVAGSAWSESTLAEQGWEVERGAARRWAVGGGLLGVLVGLVLFAPAAWLTGAIASATDQRLLLADAQGTIWSGSAVPVLTGGAGSRDASMLPGRLEWTLSPRLYGALLTAREACCIGGTMQLQIRPGLGRIKATLLAPPTGLVGQWPSAWLNGYGTPLNTLQLGGTFRVMSPGFTVEQVEGRWRLEGRVDLELEAVSSRLTTLDTLGTYRISLTGDANSNSATLLSLTTQDGALQLSGNGTWGPGGVKFRGEARAAGVDESVLSNLLNIIGRRDGARSIISIG
ncbi:MAG: type II secretion system protein N [Pseudomonadota bacterium]|nr:type II secretion system protein N [Pseudomonadota bacterium]